MRAAALMAAALLAIARSGVAMAEDIPELMVHSGWRKFCFNGKETDFKRMCVTRAELRRPENNSLFAAVEFVDREGEARKVVRVTFPLGMQLVHGTRLIVYGKDPLRSPYILCTAAGCLSDYEATPELLVNMRTGQALVVQAIDQTGKPLSATLSLAGYPAAHDGPPSEPIDQIIEPRSKPWLDDTLRPELRPRER